MGTPPHRGIRPQHFSTRLLHPCAGLFLLLSLTLPHPTLAQDGSASLQGVVEDISGARIPGAKITVVDPARGFRSEAVSDAQGQFIFGMLSPGRYDIGASAPGMTTKTSHGVELYVGGVAVLQVRLALVGATETVIVREQPEPVETQVGDVSQVITQQAIQGLPLNGRRFTDLALLTPGVTQDPRGLTSNSNGDLSFGGTRGFQNSFLVDGADNNNSFFAQARGRYRAPYQFSNAVIKEFRVSSNAYSAELGKAGGAVFNVVTKSGTNDWHGSAFPTTMQGNAGFGKLDFTISPKQVAFLRLSTSRYTGTNYVFFDPSSPITTYAESANGTEDVKTESLAASLTSMWTSKLATTLRVQFSRDAEQSYANTEAPWTKI